MSLPTPTEGWVGESRPVPEALTDTFTPPPFNGVEAGRDWVPLEEKLDADGWALLMRFGTIGEPHA